MRVPGELVAVHGKGEISKALGDVSKAQAIILARELSAQWEARFLTEQHQRGLTANLPAPASVAGNKLEAKGIKLTPGAKVVAALVTPSAKVITVRFTVK